MDGKKGHLFFFFVVVPPIKKITLFMANGSLHAADDDGMDCDVDSLCAGLSKILLTRGDRYAVDAGIRRLELEERWSWEARSSYDSTRYLDASCLVFGPGRTFLEAVDYQSKRNSSRSGLEGAIRHSGDMLRSVLCEGTHTVSVDLDRLSPDVSELFICLSAWAGARLGEIRAPSVTLVDPDAAASAAIGGKGGGGGGFGAFDDGKSNNDSGGGNGGGGAGALCEYRLEGVSKADLDRYSSVVMCRVYRDSGNSPTTAIGGGGGGGGVSSTSTSSGAAGAGPSSSSYINAFSSGGSTPVAGSDGGGDINTSSSDPFCPSRQQPLPTSTNAGGGGGIFSAGSHTQQQWRVEAIGQLGHGHADNYEPLLASIRNELSLADSLAGWKV